MDKKVVLIHLLELHDSLLSNGVEVVVADEASIVEVDQRVSHFPDRDGSSLEEAFDPVVVVHEVQFGASAIFRFGFENSLFDSSVR